jgi:DNA-binding response OmpR family regulator
MIGSEAPMEGATVLVVDDERKIRELIRLYLEHEGYSVLLADSGMGALEAVDRAQPDLLVLDLMLPDLSGEEVARSLRTHTDVPIIMLTAKSSEEDRIGGFRAGADDYVTKPFSPRELVVRVGAVLRRSRGVSTAGSSSFDKGRFTISRAPRVVTVNGARVDLSRCEFNLLAALTARPGCVFPRDELIRKVQGDGFDGCERAIDAHVKNLRRKLGDDPRRPRFVMTVWGVGYKFGLVRDGAREVGPDPDPDPWTLASASSL